MNVTDWQPFSLRGKERFPSMIITCASIQMVERIAEETDTADIITESSCDGAHCE